VWAGRSQRHERDREVVDLADDSWRGSEPRGRHGCSPPPSKHRSAQSASPMRHRSSSRARHAVT
jgi:hypothetical protein